MDEDQPSRGSGDEDEGVETLEEARNIIKDLRERHRLQALQLISWRRRYKAQGELMTRINSERNEQLKKLSMQLLLFEARLCRKQRDIGALLAHREAVISRQRRVIKSLQSRLSDAGVEPPKESNLDSLNDSDSAVILEDDDMLPPPHNGVTVVRSVSDALEAPSSNKYSFIRLRSSSLLRRPEVLETVYSVEEDGDGDGGGNALDSSEENDFQPSNELKRPPRLKELSGSFERLDQDPPPHLNTYNRVMSNHRSVTKPKDVKYKRINKAKSKSLEELRGRLKNWVDKSNKINVSLDHVT